MLASVSVQSLATVARAIGPAFCGASYIRRIKTFHAMSAHDQEGHFPEEAEQNEIGGPVTLAIMVLAMVVLILWAAC